VRVEGTGREDCGKCRDREARRLCECGGRSAVVLRVGEKADVSDEVLLLIKTTRGRFGQLQERVKELHSYEVPEIVGVPIQDAFGKYLEWMDKCVM